MNKKLDLCLQPSESLSAGIRRLFEMLVEEAIKRIQFPGRDRETDIHAVRTGIKQIRALLRLIRPVIGDSIFHRRNVRLKRTAQLLAPMRDATIGLKTIRKLADKAGHQQGRSDISVIEFHFSREVESEQCAHQEMILEAAVRALKADRRYLRALRLKGAEWSVIFAGLEDVYRACRQRMKRAFEQGGDDDFHRWRICLKNLYYELQFLMPILPKRLRPMVARLKKLQEQIGEDHDLVVLKAVLQKTPSSFGGAAAIAPVLRRLKRRSRKLRRASQPLAEKVFGEKPRRFMRNFSALG